MNQSFCLLVCLTGQLDILHKQATLRRTQRQKNAQQRQQLQQQLQLQAELQHQHQLQQQQHQQQQHQFDGHQTYEQGEHTGATLKIV